MEYRGGEVIDFDRVKQTADLLAICGRDTSLGTRPAASTNGGEYKGACPFCGGKNRFYVQPNARPFPRWACRQCTPGGDTVIGYIAKRDNLDPKNKNDMDEICRRALGGNLPEMTGPRPAPVPVPAYQPPVWQGLALTVIGECEARLWQPGAKFVLDYLRGRGLRDETIKRYRLGYNPTGYKVAGEYWLDQGIIIPCIVRGEVWYIKVRRRQGADPKYLCMTGSKPAAIFNAESLRGADVALFCEGEFDCMIAQQEVGDVVACATLGSATNIPDLASWGAYLIPLERALIAYDTDKAGQAGAKRIARLLRNPTKIELPDGAKDINDYFLAGGNLWQLLKIRMD